MSSSCQVSGSVPAPALCVTLLSFLGVSRVACPCGAASCFPLLWTRPRSDSALNCHPCVRTTSPPQGRRACRQIWCCPLESQTGRKMDGWGLQSIISSSMWCCTCTFNSRPRRLIISATSGRCSARLSTKKPILNCCQSSQRRLGAAAVITTCQMKLFNPRIATTRTGPKVTTTGWLSLKEPRWISASISRQTIKMQSPVSVDVLHHECLGRKAVCPAHPTPSAP